VIGNTVNHSKRNAQFSECIDRGGGLFHVGLHFFFFGKSSREKAQVSDRLFLRIVHAGGALKPVVRCPKPAIRPGRGAADKRSFFDDSRF